MGMGLDGSVYCYDSLQVSYIIANNKGYGIRDME
jgi:hypothetical protein